MKIIISGILSAFLFPYYCYDFKDYKSLSPQEKEYLRFVLNYVDNIRNNLIGFFSIGIFSTTITLIITAIFAYLKLDIIYFVFSLITIVLVAIFMFSVCFLYQKRKQKKVLLNAKNTFMRLFRNHGINFYSINDSLCSKYFSHQFWIKDFTAELRYIL